jgi:hypothetical protein
MSNIRQRIVKWTVLSVSFCVALVALAFAAHWQHTRLHLFASPPPAPNISARFATFTVRASTDLDDSLSSDAPGSFLTDNDGTFHYFATLSQYDNTDQGDAFIKTYTNTDFGEMNRHPGANKIVTDDTFLKNPGSLCYKIDKRAKNPIETPYEDDHCDVIGTWIDHDTGTWYGIVHDEYFFNPWSPDDKGDVLSAIHFDRLMYATSTNHGVSWELQDEIITSPFGDKATNAAFPGKTWYFGDGDPRLYVDYSTGYFYLYYYSRIFLKSGPRIASYPNVARAPISGKMARGTWNKWYGGGWTEPGIGGREAPVGSDLAMTYTPATDTVIFSGKAANGTSIRIQSYLAPTSGRYEFADPTTHTNYYINLEQPRRSGLRRLVRWLGLLSPRIINAATGASVPFVNYVDDTIGQQVIVQIVNDTPQVRFVNQRTGAILVQNPDINSLSYRVTATNGLYGAVQANGAVVTFNTYLNQYLSVDDVSVLSDVSNDSGTGFRSGLYAWSNTDLGNQNGWKLIGELPPGTDYGYYNWIMDVGSLTTNMTTGSSFRRYDLDVNKFWDISFPAPTAGVTYFGQPLPLLDSRGTPISASKSYILSQTKPPAAGGNLGAPVDLGGQAKQWRIQPIPDPFDPSMPSGFYRIVEAASGTALRVLSSAAGATDVVTLRSVGAKVGTQGNPPNNSNPAALGNDKSPGGSDEWYFEPIASDLPAISLAGSTGLPQTGSTTLDTTAKSYRIVNRNSGLVLDFSAGVPQLSPDHFAAEPAHRNPAYRTNLAVTIIAVGE